MLINIHITDNIKNISATRDDGTQLNLELDEDLNRMIAELVHYINKQQTPEEKRQEAVLDRLEGLMTEEEKVAAPQLFPLWEPNTYYKTGRTFVHEDVVYSVIQEHTSQADWPPDKTPALFRRLSKVEEVDEVPEFVRPTGAHDAYSMGDRVKFKDKTYESLLNGNVYSPEEYPAGWKEISE